MHLGETPSRLSSHSTAQHAAAQPQAFGLDFLWLELTNRCNLQCVHCYTESHPHSGDRDLLTRDDYVSLMLQAYELGCRKLQFIGGEPQLNPHFHELMVEAKRIGFSFIEVYSNLTRLDDATLDFAASNGICFATSVYSDKAAGHDAITKVRSSHTRTISNLKRLIGAGIETRAAIIVVDQDAATVGRTRRFLSDLGVGHVNHAETRPFGRGEQVLHHEAGFKGLCGHCWAGKLCVAPDGQAYSCVMARNWPVGNVIEAPLADIVEGRALARTRQTIYDEVWLPKIAASRAAAAANCSPEEPQCGPDTGKPDCAPELNPPTVEPDPGKSDPACFPCPQSCSPDFKVPPCNPAPCPQSCDPFPTTKEQ